MADDFKQQLRDLRSYSDSEDEDSSVTHLNIPGSNNKIVVQTGRHNAQDALSAAASTPAKKSGQKHYIIDVAKAIGVLASAAAIIKVIVDLVSGH